MADNGSHYVASRFKITAQIGSVKFEDVLSCSATFGLNSIPSATLIVASGKDYVNNQIATIHKRRNDIKHRDKAVVTLTIENAPGGQTDMMQDGTYVIFDGYLAGIGYQRAFDSCSYTLHLLHWLDDLNNSSMVNGNWFPGAPYDLAQNAAYHALTSPLGEGAGGGLKDGKSAVPVIDPNLEFIKKENLGKDGDLWGKVLKPIFTRIAKWPPPRWQHETEEKNDAAIKALERMPGNLPGVINTPLRLELGGMGDQNIARCVQKALSRDAMSSFAYTTFWSKLVGEYAPQFYFAISPGTEHALAIPFFAGLNKPYKTITSNEYGYSSFQANMSQIIEAVEIYWPAPSGTGFGNGGQTARGVSFARPFGLFPNEPTPDNKRGMRLLKEPPTWLTNTIALEDMAGFTTGVTSDKKPGDGSKSQTGEPKPPKDFEEGELFLRRLHENKIMDKFAEQWYKTEVLYQRHGELSGKLRFDIAPGSILEIDAPPFDLAEPDKFDKFYATVTQVSYVINGEKATAGTSFVLAHIRTEAENKMTELLTAPKPPLYVQEWSGGPLAVRKGN